MELSVDQLFCAICYFSYLSSSIFGKQVGYLGKLLKITMGCRMASQFLGCLIPVPELVLKHSRNACVSSRLVYLVCLFCVALQHLMDWNCPQFVASPGFPEITVTLQLDEYLWNKNGWMDG